MNRKINQQTVIRKAAASTGDRGLSQYMQRIYLLMTGGLSISAAVAYWIASSPAAVQAIFQSGLYWLVLFAPFILVLVLATAITRMSGAVALATFVLYSAIMGVSFSTIFLVYTQQSIFSVFLIAGGLFGGFSLYGYTTHKDLTSMGSFLIMGLWGIILALLVNLFFKSSHLSLALSVISVVVFTGLAAFDVQKLRLIYDGNDSADTLIRKTVLGALSLYLDFINIFMNLLRLLGNRK